MFLIASAISTPTAMKKLLPLILLTLLFKVALGQSQPEKFHSSVEGRLQAGDTLGALAGCRAITSLGTCSWEFYTAQGLIKYLTKDYAGAIFEYDKAIGNVASYAPAYYFRGLAEEMLGYKQEALNDYSQALELNPFYSESYFRRGKMYAGIGFLKEALDDLTIALFLNPKSAEAFQLRAHIYGSLGAYKLQIKDYNRLAKLQPSSELFYLRGLAKMKYGKYQAALSDFNEALALDPTRQNALEQKQLAQFKLSQGKEELAVLKKNN
jgi:tetratricopeptide (TPR) repeat protein